MTAAQTGQRSVAAVLGSSTALARKKIYIVLVLF